MRNLKVVLWDKVNDTPIDIFSNPPLGMKIEVDLEDHEMRVGTLELYKTTLDICPGDVFEIRVMEGLK